MQYELLATLGQHLVNHLLVELGAEGYSRERLGLTTGEDCRTVCSGQIAYLAPDGANLVGLTTVQTDAFVKDKVTYSFFFYIVVVKFG